MNLLNSYCFEVLQQGGEESKIQKIVDLMKETESAPYSSGWEYIKRKIFFSMCYEFEISIFQVKIQPPPSLYYNSQIPLSQDFLSYQKDPSNNANFAEKLIHKYEEAKSSIDRIQVINDLAYWFSHIPSNLQQYSSVITQKIEQLKKINLNDGKIFLRFLIDLNDNLIYHSLFQYFPLYNNSIRIEKQFETYSRQFKVTDIQWNSVPKPSKIPVNLFNYPELFKGKEEARTTFIKYFVNSYCAIISSLVSMYQKKPDFDCHPNRNIIDRRMFTIATELLFFVDNYTESDKDEKFLLLDEIRRKFERFYIKISSTIFFPICFLDFPNNE